MVKNINYLNSLIMKATLSILLISFLMGICNAQTGEHESDALSMNNTNDTVDTLLLHFYRQYSLFTDPGEYEYLYKKLPDSLP
jgi:hypothetical protein